MRKILLTGMSGTGKSTALAELEKRGFDVVDTDEGGWSEWSDADGGYVWREDRITELLARKGESTLYVSGTVSNQGRFYGRFDAVCSSAGLRRGRQTTTESGPKIGSSSCANWQRLNRCCAQPARMKSTRASRSTS